MAKRSFGQLIRPWIPAALWVGVIACESTGLFSSENTGKWLWQIVTGLFGAVNRHEFQVTHAILRKCGHFIGYGVLGYLFYAGWRGTYFARLPLTRDQLRTAFARCWRRRWAVLAVGMTALVASLDELHQTMLPARTGAFHDVLLDTFGASVALWLVYLANRPQPVIEPVRDEEKVV